MWPSPCCRIRFILKTGVAAVLGGPDILRVANEKAVFLPMIRRQIFTTKLSVLFLLNNKTRLGAPI